jgi:hypothetical protein
VGSRAEELKKNRSEREGKLRFEGMYTFFDDREFWGKKAGKPGW